MSNAPPPEKKRPGANRAHSTQLIAAGYTSERDLQLACLTARAAIETNSKLDDLLVLMQQQNDLLRALLRKP